VLLGGRAALTNANADVSPVRNACAGDAMSEDGELMLSDEQLQELFMTPHRAAHMRRRMGE